jgi:hypothetical protein
LDGTHEMDAWSRSERVENQVEYLGSADMSMIIEPDVLERLTNKGVRTIDDLNMGEKDICWFCTQSTTMKKTKNGKAYLLIDAVGPTGKSHRLSVWGWNGTRSLSTYALCLGEVERNDFGYSTTSWKLKVIGEE